MTRKVILGSAVLASVVLLAVCGMFTSFMSVLGINGAAFANPCRTDIDLGNPVAASAGSFEQWNPQQAAHAAVITTTGKTRGVRPRGWVVAVATAMQESTLRNLANSGVPRSLSLPHDGVAADHDSVGLFQQRPSPPDGQGFWGRADELMTPATAAGKFYTALLAVNSWESMRVTDAAQAVQRSAFPDAYQKWEGPAQRLVAHILGLPNLEQIGGGDPAAPCGPEAAGNLDLPPGSWTQPVHAAWSPANGFRAPSRLDHDGVDLMAVRYAPIRAAADGSVIVSTWNGSTGNCNVDGSPDIGGCGWYVEINHAGSVNTRYCHMTRQPEVSVGQQVRAGQVIGYVGSSGNSSGPHLHYEVHRNIPAGSTGSSANAVDPVAFHAAIGAPLGVGNSG